MKRAAASLFVLGGCLFEPPIASNPPPIDQDQADRGEDQHRDPRPGAPADLEVDHIPMAQRYAGTADLMLDSLEIDTDAPHLLALPEGALFEVTAQLDPNAPEVAVLHVHALLVPKGSIVRVIGSRPLIVVAGGEVRIEGVLDASARGAIPGAGGYPPGQGEGKGADGLSYADGIDLGGGGGSFGTRGGSGGNRAAQFGGSPGAFDGDLSLLRGGAGGGNGSADGCDPTSGGSGGGAIQIHSEELIEIEGLIDVGGGGGGGGSDCNWVDAAAGGGGGSGGAIELDAERITISGSLTANGGGGGGAGSGVGGLDELPGPGEGGEDGRIDLAASGGTAGGPRGTAGGRGSFEGVGADGGSRTEPGNTGGGGGGGGRISIRSRTALLTGTIVPPPILGSL